ncbi:bacteriocin immunity protein [Providencia alcalifaciens]|uniref:bacteriocin immunity protein n=1 Tax=Providencia alcalifaciens TaxID=126385 RepID=UPI001CC4BEC0|nr:bacteriocin immunity protein [Providencia alcalifaciens]UBX51019.1 bacteriocin immunity protein [Providencia alcalifaciens]CAG9430930.1 Colicin-E9 immunity protein [Providencia alcalifaciens]
MELKNNFSDYTEAEFLKFLQAIYYVQTENENEHKLWVRHFVKISEHPQGNGLIYNPNSGDDDSPEGILKSVKEWRAKNGKPGFKNS